MWSPDSSITGLPISGITSPAFPLAADLAPAPNARQYYVSSISGSGWSSTADSHSIDRPFTATLFRPVVLKSARFELNAGLGGASTIKNTTDRNVYTLLIRKGADCSTLISSGVHDYQLMTAKVEFSIPVGISNDTESIKKMVSFLGGLLTEETDDLVQSLYTGVI